MLFQAAVKAMETLNETELNRTENELTRKKYFAHMVQIDSGIRCQGSKGLGTVLKNY